MIGILGIVAAVAILAGGVNTAIEASQDAGQPVIEVQAIQPQTAQTHAAKPIEVSSPRPL